jgi:hypothetical protein
MSTVLNKFAEMLAAAVGSSRSPATIFPLSTTPTYDLRRFPALDGSAQARA